MPPGTENDKAVPVIRGRFLHKVHAIGDVPILDVYADCREMLDVLGLDALDDIAAAPDAMELFLLGKDYPRSVRVFPPDGIFTRGKPAQGNEGYLEWYGKGSAVHDTIRNRAVLIVPGMKYYNPDFVSRGIVRPLLDRMLVARGYIPLHAAAVTGRHALILSGKPGAGKTTLLMGLLERGLNYLADDRTVLTHDGGKAVVHKFPEHIRAAESNGPKRSIPPRLSNIISGELRLVVFLEPDHGSSRIERISLSEGAARFVSAIPPAIDTADWVAMSDVAVSIATSVSMWVLRGWDDALDRIGVLERLIDEWGVR